MLESLVVIYYCNILIVVQYKFPLTSITVKKAQDEENFLNAIEIIYNNNKSIQTSITTLKEMKLFLETITANGMVIYVVDLLIEIESQCLMIVSLHCLGCGSI